MEATSLKLAPGPGQKYNLSYSKILPHPVSLCIAKEAMGLWAFL